MTGDDSSSLLLREIFLAGFMSGLPAANVAWAAARLASTMNDVRLEPGGVVYRKGDPSDDHFFVVGGEVKLETEDAPAWTFGERSLIGTIDLTLGRPRSRTAVATRPTHLLRMPGQDWLDMLEDNFELTRAAYQGLATGIDELRIALGDFEVNVPQVATPPPVPAPSGRIGLIDRILVLRSIPLFAQADVQALTNLAVLSQEASFAPGEAVLARGEPHDSLFVVVSGEVSGTRAESGRRERFGPGRLVFGSSAPASANLAHDARAEIATRALRIAREDYLDVMEEHFALALSALRSVSLEREALINERERRRSPPRLASA